MKHLNWRLWWPHGECRGNVSEGRELLARALRVPPGHKMEADYGLSPGPGAVETWPPSLKTTAGKMLPTIGKASLCSPGGHSMVATLHVKVKVVTFTLPPALVAAIDRLADPVPAIKAGLTMSRLWSSVTVP